ncbi:acyl-CoA carboxylase subunit beta [Corynebacterium frankenforstense]|uniref:acyl-CoA carboxylase subunit beta n=1 Tax=Corynebacterium frankenforstense TaxID=1230998 RepID=UPI0026EA92EA|nr:acyl-CoA carboxylase subunit beta [Corynebacterium frankenforstense]
MTDLSTTAGKLAGLQQRLEEAHAPRGEKAVEATHEAGRLTARERVEYLLDHDSFVEIDALARHRVEAHGLDADRPATDGIVAGYGTVDGRKICVFAQDRDIFDGRLGEVHGEKITKVQKLAATTGVPLVAFLEGAGARAAENVAAMAFYSTIIAGQAKASGLIPQISVVTGELTGPHALLASLADFTVMVEGGAAVSLTPPEIITTVTGAEVDPAADLGAQAHAATSGTAHLTAADDASAVTAVAELLGVLPANNRAEAPRDLDARVTGPISENVTDRDRELDAVIPDDSTVPYDVREVIERVVDNGWFLELQAAYADNVVTGFGRIEGRAVAVVANQPVALAGCLSAAAAEKAARFIRVADSFNIPVVTFVDVPGFLPDTGEELAGVVRCTGKLAAAYAEAAVGTLTVVTRKAMGTAAMVMGAKHLGADLVFAWPTAEIAAVTADVAVPEIHAAELAKAERRRKDTAAMREKFTAEYEAEALTPYLAAERGLVDAVIPPNQTRGQLVEGLRLFDRKVIYPPAKKHPNTPL